MVVGKVNPGLDQDQVAVLVVMVEVKDHMFVPVCFLIYFNRFLREKSVPGGSGACFIMSLTFFPQHQVF